MNASINDILESIAQLPIQDQQLVVKTANKRLHNNPTEQLANKSNTARIEPEKNNGIAIVEILERMAARKALSYISNPSAWQREIRKDRLLPGRK